MTPSFYYYCSLIVGFSYFFNNQINRQLISYKDHEFRTVIVEWLLREIFLLKIRVESV